MPVLDHDGPAEPLAEALGDHPGIGVDAKPTMKVIFPLG
jgi:hypothetical protein